MKKEIDILRETNFETITEQELENLLPTLGMNNEVLNEMPFELSEFFGKGLHFWQYPNQFSKFIKYIHNKSISSYLEIGCRWGGTFIILNEILKKNNPQLESYACDIIPMSSILKEYQAFSNFNYVQESSLEVDNIKKKLPSQIDFVLIDGDHSYEGVKNDYELSLSLNPKYIMFHDITSQICPGVGHFWNEIKNKYKNFEYTEQYESVNGYFLGIGIIELI